MSRRPVDQLAKSRDPEGRQALWGVIRAQEGWFPARVLFAETWMNRRTIGSYLGCLVAGGLMEKRLSDAGVAEYRLIRDPGREAPRLRPDGTEVIQGRGTENLWRSMQRLRQFTPRDLAVHSTNDLVQVSEWTAKSYCSLLYATGYLRLIEKGTRSHQATYRLIRNSGRAAPMIQRVKHVYDPNTGQVYVPGVTE